MLDRFRSHLQESRLIPESATLLVGFSGGPDSACLLDLLHKTGIDVVAAHLNHQQRPEAAQDVQAVQAFCDARQIPLVVGKADVPQIARDLKIGLEEAGRHARYTFFQQAAYQTQAHLVATAHTLDDLLETVVLNLARGAGLSGLAGIPEQRENIVRPLLPFTRQETQNYCQESGLLTLHDSANDNLDFARVRVRRRIVPELETINPEVRQNVLRNTALIREEDQFLDGMAAAALEKAERPPNGQLAFLTADCELVLDRETLAVLPDVILRRALRLAFNVLGANLDHHQTTSLAQTVRQPQTASLTAEGGKVVAEIDPQSLHLRDLNPTEPFRFPLTIPGETVSDHFGWQLVAENWSPTDYKREPRALEAVIDPTALRGSLFFRSAEPGDRFQPLGLEGTQSVADLLTNLKLTLAAKKRLPIICDMIGPVWVPGAAIAERAKIQPDSRRALRIKFEPIRPMTGS